jgi:hypothetical protein
MSKSTVCGLVALAVIGIGGLAGYALSFLPGAVAVIAIVLLTAFSLFVGMVLASVRHRELTAEKNSNDDIIIASLHKSALKLLAAQSKTYGEVSKAMSNIVSNRVGIRIVEEMLHGLENEEQRDAAYRQVGAIINEELAKINKEVWGDKPCPKDDSGG